MCSSLVCTGLFVYSSLPAEVAICEDIHDNHARESCLDSLGENTGMLGPILQFLDGIRVEKPVDVVDLGDHTRGHQVLHGTVLPLPLLCQVSREK